MKRLALITMLFGTLIIAFNPQVAKAQTITCYYYQHSCMRDITRLVVSGRCGIVTWGPTIYRIACPD